MAEETLPGIDQAALAAATAVAPDSLTATILVKHAAGEKLTPQECGKLGAYKRKASGAPVGRPRKDGSPAQPSGATAAAGRSPVAGLAPTEAGDGGLPVPPADPLLISRTVGVVLARMDQAAQTWVKKTVASAGGNDELAREYCAQAALPAESQSVIKDLSPIMAEGYGVNARNFPTMALLITVAGWLFGLGLVMWNLRRLSRDHAAIFAKAAERPYQPAASGAPQPVNPTAN